jgi:adenylate cyclase
MVIARDAAGRRGVLTPHRARLDGALVLVGTRLIDDLDFYYAPVDMSRKGVMFGVEIHGYVLDNLLTGAGILDRAIVTGAGRTPWTSVVSTLGICMAGSIVLACFTLLPGMLLWLFITGCYLALVAYAFNEQGVWLDVSLPVSTLLVVLVYHMTSHYRAERAKAERRKQIFARFVNPEMVNRILELDEVVLAGDRSHITVLFSDIRGFTSISEGMDPKALLDLLNEYFSLMSPVMLKHDGTHDKYIGDAIMGFYGAPIGCADHARQAVATAVEMLELNEKLRSERPGWFDIGFGINTGDAVTGFVGARDGAVSYSAIGDTVNLASRLEGLNKEHGTHILISESTCMFVRDAFECVPIGEIKVKGKKEPVRVFEVQGRKGQPPIAGRRAHH